MRWIFLAVFSLNLAYIAWQISVPDDGVYADIQPLKNVKAIVLLSEMKLIQEAEKAELLAANALTQEAAVEKNENESAVVAESVAETAEQIPAEKNSVETSVDEPVAAKPKEAGTEAIVVAGVDDGEVKAPVSIESATTTSCFTLGPFRDLAKLRGFTREIMPYVSETDFRGRNEKEQSLYWVYVNPEKTRKKAVATGKRLKAKKIKDFYLIREGEKLHGLSLGHFRNKNGAYGLAKKVRKLGFDVTVEPVFKTYTIYWLDYRLSEGAKIPQSIFDKHIKLSKKDKISRLGRDCAD